MVIIKRQTKLEHQITEANRSLFSAWVEDPAKISLADSEEIESMVAKFPCCQILQSFRAKAAKKQPQGAFNLVLARASLYSPDRRVLFHLINRPEDLKPVTSPVPQQTETYYQVIEDDDYSADLVQQEPEEEKVAELSVPDLSYTDTQEPFVMSEDEGQSEPVNEEQLTAESDTQESLGISEAEAKPADEEKEPDLEEAGQEIGSAADEAQPVAEEPERQTGAEEIPETPAWTDEDKIILENIAAADFFAFEEKLDQIQGEQNQEAFVTENVETRSVIDPEEVAKVAEKEESQVVARYDDDSMPYSFLWWLHKTRNEHAETYQPYVEFKLDTNRPIKKAQGQELNQQIIENIFHLQSPLDDLKSNPPQTVHFEVKRKEEEIIEKFIREEPQIHPPSPDKLDMENKARRSAEDPNDLVSETLASIYTEQMLFHKAIDTYQKLSLKFPEKRAYFADQISELQKKIN